jgi:hypothetical protein
MFAQDLTYGYYSLNKKHGDPKKPLDWAIVEATEILEDGSIVPGASVGATPEILQTAEKIIIEVNTSLPSFKGLHDVRSLFPRFFPFLPLPFLFSLPPSLLPRTFTYPHALNYSSRTSYKPSTATANPDLALTSPDRSSFPPFADQPILSPSPPPPLPRHSLL